MNKQRGANILFAGTGGQGVLTAAEICSWAALLEGFHVKKSEVHGMAQRGGSVESHVRFGTIVFAPLIPLKQADFLVSFNFQETERLKKFLSPHGKDFDDDLKNAQSQLSDKRTINTYILGILSAHLPIQENNWMSALAKVFSPKILEENTKIFLKGRKKALKK